MIFGRIVRLSAKVSSGRSFSSNSSKSAKVLEPLIVNGITYERDGWTNVKPSIQSYIGRNIYLQQNHPLSILRKRIVDHFYQTFTTNRGNPLFSVVDHLNPVVSIEQNFDTLLIPKDHVSRNKNDSFYLNRNHMLRAHCTAHQVDLLKSGLDNFLIIGDVYRRDEVNCTHYPVFHQIDAVRTIRRDKLFEAHNDLEIFESNYELLSTRPADGIVCSAKLADVGKQPCHTLEAVKLVEYELKTVLVSLVKTLFGEKIKYRWVDAYFPFTQPSWELEIWYNDDWLEVLGSGIMRNEILRMSGIHNTIGWAFGIGLERLAMILYNISDIRLFWSNDTGFLCQFDESKTTAAMQYKPISKFNQCYMDVSFWLPDEYDLETFPVNSFYALVRDVGGDIVEQVIFVDKFFHPTNQKNSFCFRIIYRHMERHLTRDEVNIIHVKIRHEIQKEFNVEARII